MRVGYIGYFSDFHTEWGVAAALEKYAEVDRYEVGRVDRKKFTACGYDIVITTAPYAYKADFWLTQRGVKIAHYFDLIVGWHGREKMYFPPLKHFDLVLSTDGSENPFYEAAGIRRRYLKQGFNPEWHHPVKVKSLARDVAFIGKMYSGRRHKMQQVLSKRYDFQCFGGGGYRGPEHAKVCASSKVMVCDNAVNDLPGYWSNRVYLHLACGGFVMHPRVPGIEEVFTDGEHLILYDGIDDLVEKIDHYLSLGAERKRIAEAGCRYVHQFHTWDARMEEMWPLISRLVS